MELKLVEFSKVLVPLLEEMNTHEDVGELGNPLYSERIYFPLVFRFAKCADLYNVWAITISPRDSTLNNYSCKQLDKKILSYFDSIGIHAIIYPEISLHDRYHYHGIVWTLKDQSLNYTILLKYLNKYIGNTYSQQSTFTTNSYKTYNPKKNCNQTTSLLQIITYITKQVNYKRLLDYLNADNTIHNKLEHNKGSKKMLITPVITTIKVKLQDYFFKGTDNSLGETDEFQLKI